MKNDKFWCTLFWIMIGLILIPLITLSTTLLSFDSEFILIYLNAVLGLVLIILMSIKYIKGAYNRKEYTRRALSLYLPYLPFPLYTFLCVYIYYATNCDNDPLGYLWVIEVIPNTLIFFIVGGVIILISNAIAKKKK